MPHGASLPRVSLLRRALVAVALVEGVLLVGAGAAHAALPPKGAKFAFHDHQTAGKNWHVEVQIDSNDPKKIKTLVVYSQLCNGTVASTGVPISDAGVVAAGGGLNAAGAWSLQATFTEPTKLAGAMRMTRAGCDTGLLTFPNAITGDGHTDHSHSGGGHAHGKQYPDFAGARLKHSRQARRVHKRVLKHWRGVSVARAEQRGFRRNTALKQKLGIFHVYNRRYERDKRIFDAKRPESLVFWRPAQGQPVILGPMFRVPPGKRPVFGGPIPIYHSHASKRGKIKSQMTHVWMVRGRKSAWANCLPVFLLEQYNPAFKFAPGLSNHEHVGNPCK